MNLFAANCRVCVTTRGGYRTWRSRSWHRARLLLPPSSCTSIFWDFFFFSGKLCSLSFVRCSLAFFVSVFSLNQSLNH